MCCFIVVVFVFVVVVVVVVCEHLGIDLSAHRCKLISTIDVQYVANIMDIISHP